MAQTLLSVPALGTSAPVTPDNRQPTTRAQRAYHSPCSASRPSPSAPPRASRSSSSRPRSRKPSERSPAATASPQAASVMRRARTLRQQNDVRRGRRKPLVRHERNRCQGYGFHGAGPGERHHRKRRRHAVDAYPGKGKTPARSSRAVCLMPGNLPSIRCRYENRSVVRSQELLPIQRIEADTVRVDPGITGQVLRFVDPDHEPHPSGEGDVVVLRVEQIAVLVRRGGQRDFRAGGGECRAEPLREELRRQRGWLGKAPWPKVEEGSYQRCQTRRYSLPFHESRGFSS